MNTFFLDRIAIEMINTSATFYILLIVYWDNQLNKYWYWVDNEEQ